MTFCKGDICVYKDNILAIIESISGGYASIRQLISSEVRSISTASTDLSLLTKTKLCLLLKKKINSCDHIKNSLDSLLKNVESSHGNDHDDSMGYNNERLLKDIIENEETLSSEDLSKFITKFSNNVKYKEGLIETLKHIGEIISKNMV